MRVSHDFLTNVVKIHFHLQDHSECVSLHSYDCHLVLFFRQIVASCFRAFSRLLYDIRRSVTKLSQCKFAKILRRHSHKHSLTLSYDSCTTIYSLVMGLQIFWQIN